MTTQRNPGATSSRAGSAGGGRSSPAPARRHCFEIADAEFADRLKREADKLAAARDAQFFEHAAPDLTDGVWGTVFGFALAAFLVLGTVWAVRSYDRAITQANHDAMTRLCDENGVRVICD